MSGSYVDELLDLAAEIMALDRAENSLGKGPGWKAAKQQYDDAVGRFNLVREVFVNALLVDGRNWPELVDSVEQDIDAFEAAADESWNDAIQYTRDNLMPYLKKEARKPPLLRTAIKRLPLALGVIAAIIYFGIKLTSGIDVSGPIDSKLGIQQRADAAEKVIQYDDWMGTHVRRGGWLKGILLWPIEPSEAEIKAASEFVSLALDGYDVLTQRSEICGTLTGGAGGKISDGQIKFVDEISEEIQSGNLNWQEPPVMTVLQPIKEKFPCK